MKFYRGDDDEDYDQNEILLITWDKTYHPTAVLNCR